MNKHLPLALAVGMLMVFSLNGCKNSHNTNESSKQEMEDDELAEPSENFMVYAPINGHEWVDLGLSVKWATCNVGASSPSEYGNYYAWGETRTKSEYTRDNCVTYGKNMRSIAGNSQYDAARANWGGTWRLPTKEEIDELINKCTRVWTTQGGHNGYEITGPNGNSIFLPATGWRNGSSLSCAGDYGRYWGATPNEDFTNSACYFYFSSGGFLSFWNGRGKGQTVRPVSE